MSEKVIYGAFNKKPLCNVGLSYEFLYEDEHVMLVRQIITVNDKETLNYALVDKDE